MHRAGGMFKGSALWQRFADVAEAELSGLVCPSRAVTGGEVSTCRAVLRSASGRCFLGSRGTLEGRSPGLATRQGREGGEGGRGA